MRTTLHSLLVLLLCLSLAACAVRGNNRSNNNGGDDDDAVSNDDDAVSNDDDAVANDDDTTSNPDDDDATDTGSCDDTFFYNELDDLENFSQKTAEVIFDSGTQYGQVELTGTMQSCGNAEGYGDMDWFQVYIGCDGATDLDLFWDDSGSDLDLFLVDVEGTELIAGISEGGTPESGTVTITEPGQYWVAVGCWDGDPTGYQATLDYR